jgi:peptidoglycan/xylan/chitin deacetylase (PgdA/CDA1 family)
MQTIKNLIYIILNFLTFPFKPSRASILMYHSVGGNGFFFSVTPDDFEKQMNYLKKKKYRVVGLADLVDKIRRGERIKPKTVVITLDDGFLDNYENVYPVLKKHNFPATIFIATKYVGSEMKVTEGNLKMINWDQMKEMKASGLFEFASHTHSHPKMKNLSLNDFVVEMDESRKAFTARLYYGQVGQVRKIFAYPKGEFTQEQNNYLKENGIISFGVSSGLASAKSDLQNIPRNFIYRDCSFAEFKGKIGYGVVFYNFIKSFVPWKRKTI